MNGLIPQHSTCPHCGILRTVRVGLTDLSLCMNCRTRWRSSSISARPRLSAVEHGHPFSPEEVSRLEIYRRAVAAGFYTDWTA